jgi:hypothetical protein
MKRLSRWLCLLFGIAAAATGTAQSYETQQLILDVEKLAQLKQILTDLKEGYQLLDAGYSAVRDVSEGNFNLHKAFLDALLAVSPAVKNYQRVADIIRLQAALVSNYQAAWGQIQHDGRFQPAEIALIGQVYSGLFAQSVRGLGDLLTVLTAGAIRASDAERLAEIDEIYRGMLDQSAFLDRFNNTTGLLSLQRQSGENEVQLLRQLYGVQP